MKKMLLSIIAILAMSFAVKAQVTTLTIYNNTSCPVSYTLFAGPSGAACGSGSYVTTLPPIGPSGFRTFPNPQAAGFPAGYTFQLVSVPGNASCGTSNMSVYECTGGSQYTASTTKSVSCTGTCTPTSMTWTTTIPGMDATVTIDP